MYTHICSEAWHGARPKSHSASIGREVAAGEIRPPRLRVGASRVYDIWGIWHKVYSTWYMGVFRGPTVDSKKLEYGPGTNQAGVPFSFGSGVGLQPYSNFFGFYCNLKVPNSRALMIQTPTKRTRSVLCMFSGGGPKDHIRP